MSERTMVIPAPVARPGQPVEVRNNRIKSRVVFEAATVETAEYVLYGKLAGHWSYEVVLDRRNPRGQWMRRCVGEGNIRLMSGKAGEVRA